MHRASAWLCWPALRAERWALCKLVGGAPCKAAEARCPFHLARIAAFAHLSNRGCYAREGVAPDEEFSRIPEPDEKGVKCYSGFAPGAREVDCRCGAGGLAVMRGKCGAAAELRAELIATARAQRLRRELQAGC